jgi:site-specific DNA recombinase
VPPCASAWADQLVSGIERLNIKRRTTGGKYARAQKGLVTTSSMQPFGYDFVIQYDDRGHRVDATLRIVEDEARVVLMIYEWVVHEGLTIRGVANRLTEMGIPKYTQKGLPHRKANRRAEWSRQTVAVQVPPIVSTDLWDAAQGQLTENHRKFRRPTKNVYLLRRSVEKRSRSVARSRSLAGWSQKTS